jgi:hypothetical protein
MNFITRDDAPYAAIAAAYQNIGSQKNPKDITLLINAANGMKANLFCIYFSQSLTNRK